MRIADFGLGLSGGALKTFFQFGSVLFLERLGVYPKGIFAISGGGPVALALMQKKAWKLEKIYFEKIRPQDLFAYDWHELLIAPVLKGKLPIIGARSIFTTRVVEKAVDQEIDFDQVLRSLITLWIAVGDLVSGKILWFSNKDEGMTPQFFRAIVLGSMRIPVFFPELTCSHKGVNYQFVDPGLITNIPLKKIVEEGFSEIVLIETTPQVLASINPVHTIGEIDMRYSDMKHVHEGEGHLKWALAINRDLRVMNSVEYRHNDPRIPEEIKREVLNDHTQYMFYGKREIAICRIYPPARLSIFQKARHAYGSPTRAALSELLGAGYAAAEGWLKEFLITQNIIQPGEEIPILS